MRTRRVVPIVMTVTVVAAVALVGFLLWPRTDAQAVDATCATADYTVHLAIGHPSVVADSADIDVQRRDHSPLSLDKVSVETVMPRMGHAMPQLVAQSNGPGKYRVQGQLFLMSGLWDVMVKLTDSTGTESATVEVAVSAT